jgi:hypothetical protein
MSHPFEILLRSAKAAGFAEGLQKGRRDTEKELENLKGYVEQLESRLHREGNWRVPMVTKSRSDDDVDAVRERVKTHSQVRDSIPDCPAIKAVTFAAPAPVLPPTRSPNTRDISCLHSNPWGSISRRRRRHFRSRVCTSQFDFHSQNTGHIRYVIPPLHSKLTTDLATSSMSFPARAFSRFFGSDEGVAMRDGGTCGSGSRSVWDPGAVSGVLGWFR